MYIWCLKCVYLLCLFVVVVVGFVCLGLFFDVELELYFLIIYLFVVNMCIVYLVCMLIVFLNNKFRFYNLI